MKILILQKVNTMYFSSTRRIFRSCLKFGKLMNVRSKTFIVTILLCIIFNCFAIFVWFCNRDQLLFKTHIIINSVFYYNLSKIYTENTVTLLLNAEKQLKINEVTLNCISRNETSSLISKVQIRMGEPPIVCNWEFFIANCTTVSDPIDFGVSVHENENIVNVDFEYPENKEYPVVMCYPPMVYESRWQQIILATEIYHYYGTDLQVHYINSAMKEIVDLLELYQTKNWIKIRKFAYFDFHLDTVLEIGVHPMLEVSYRNQGVAYTDCLMRYREAAEFIIVADIDDILIPPIGDSYFDEFLHWKKIYPHATAFFYTRSVAKINVANEFKNFSLSGTIKSLKVDGEAALYGKSVYQTKYAETAWIHTPGMPHDVIVGIPPEKRVMFHVQIKDDKLLKENHTTLTPQNIISNSKLKKISDEFTSTFENFSNIRGNSVYADAIFKCYLENDKWIVSKRKLYLPKFFHCANPLKCRKPEVVSDFECKVARRNFVSKQLNQNIILHIPERKYYWWTNKDGCTVFLN